MMSSYSTEDLHKILKNDLIKHFYQKDKEYRSDKLEKEFLNALSWEKRIPMFRVRTVFETNLERISCLEDFEKLIDDSFLLLDYGIKQMIDLQVGKSTDKRPSFLQNYENILEILGYASDVSCELNMQSLVQISKVDVEDVVYNLRLAYVESKIMLNLYKEFISQVGLDSVSEDTLQSCIHWRKLQQGSVTWMTYIMTVTRESHSHSSTSDFQSLMPEDDHDSHSAGNKFPYDPVVLPDSGTLNQHNSSPEILASPRIENCPKEDPFKSGLPDEDILPSLANFKSSINIEEENFHSVQDCGNFSCSHEISTVSGQQEDDDSDIDSHVNLSLPSDFE